MQKNHLFTRKSFGEVRMKFIYLFRHGLTKEAELHLYCGSTDVPLSPKGKKLLQSQKAKMPCLEGFEFYTSGMKRSNQTATILYPDKILKTDSRLCEMDFGLFECKSYDELKDYDLYQKWIQGNNVENICPHGESGAMMKARVLSFFNEILNSKEKNKIAIFTHGGPIAAVMEFLFPQENKNRYEWQCGFGKGYFVKLDGDNSSFEKFA